MESSELLTPRSSRVKTAHKLTRRASRASARLFLAEGPQAVREALAVPGCVHEVFATPTATERHGGLRDAAAASSVSWSHVDEAAMARLAETISPQGIVAVCRFLDVSLDSVLARSPQLVVVCAHVRDPGNAGTVIRCADAVGADAVVLAGESVDAYNGKVVRASVGSLFHLPLVIAPSVDATVTALRGAGLRVLAADGAGTTSLDEALDSGRLAGATGWLFGNEAWGLQPTEADLADLVVRVPIYGRAESLNLATAVAVCLYTSARAQRAHRS